MENVKRRNTMSKKPVVLMILDGYGLNDNTKGNGIAAANTPVMDKLMKEYPYVKGYASGLAVGLPDGQMGNSEVGHLNMGAGRIVYQELTRITKAIEDGDFFENEELLGAIKRRTIQTYIYSVCYQTAVCTATLHIYMPCWNWQRETVLRMSMFTALWTDVIQHRTEEKNLSASYLTKWKN